jgi:hypothetical protein
MQDASGRSGKRAVQIGTEFPLELQIIESKRRYTVEVTRSAIALIIVYCGAAAIVLCGAVGFRTLDFGALQAVWSAVALPMGLVIGFYFRDRLRRESDDDEEDDASAA